MKNRTDTIATEGSITGTESLSIEQNEAPAKKLSRKMRRAVERKAKKIMAGQKVPKFKGVKV